ncbi:MAG: methyltransferase family protein [Candidatus Binatia bacterium]
MTADRCFDLLVLTALACVVTLGLVRGFMLYARGVHIVVIDAQRSVAQGLADLAHAVCLLFWGYAVVAYAWPLASPPVPPQLGIVRIDGLVTKAAGVVLSAAAIVIYALALRAFGDSWRLGIDRQSRTPLVTGGIFAWTRNPIYVSLDLLIFGAFLTEGRLVLLALALLNAAFFHYLIRREESALAQAYGDEYRCYRDRVGRYVTWSAAGRGRSK